MTGLEPATLGVTGRYSNQLSYTRVPLGSRAFMAGNVPCQQAETHKPEGSPKAVSRAKKKAPESAFFVIQVARVTGLEPATLGVTGRYSNQLSYTRSPLGAPPLWQVRRPVNALGTAFFIPPHKHGCAALTIP